ncbi:hypothetical protein GCM10010988_32680 [Cnuibacter physcomitrellae]|uniref:Pyridoxamine 5-phosphate oxidase n=1 Tax=Cnuibacter physcomitrellae TaxID=1619308 RepID=A0A1X9LKM0_9MICO|nr:DUF1697 domain-containing protein [Cnuibacter physcomitrellae]ARJ04481.1 pyridoxamine 5-phosphate oxidase [Cnuibacter physcomitrellae]GGI41156.1 hypothetical protein GCM10010988_32680 [Cnuibacter physcomitrellae]
MTRWAALLRGVNVNGITIRSAELKELFVSLGHGDVRTVLASGNVVFDSDDPAGTLKADIERALGERFGYDAWIVLVPHGSLETIVERYPWPETEETHPYVVFGSDESALAEIAQAAGELDAGDSALERAKRDGDVVYWECPKGSSTDTPFAKLLAKARFRSVTTTRNLRTLRKLL